MNKFISYYELLGMIKEGNIPKLVYWINHENKKIAYKRTYDSVDNSFCCYILQNRNQETEDIKFYLSECMLESSFYKECIMIPNDDFEDIKEVTYKPRKIQNTINSLIKNQQKIIQILKNKE